MENGNWAVYHVNKVHGDDAYLPPRELGPDSRLYVVCDGVSNVMKDGKAITGGGKIASQRVVQRLSQAPITSIEDVASEFMQLSDELSSTSDETAMTTATAALVKKNRLYVLNVGDSPAFHIRGRTITRMTKNDTEQRDGREYLANAIGMEMEYGLECNLKLIDVIPGDMLIMTTDGVRIGPDELAEISSKEQTPTAVAKRIETLLIERTGLRHDDITASIVRF